MNLFLTGATGFLGQYILAELLSRRHKVWALYRDEEKRCRTVKFVESVGCETGDARLKWLKGEILEVNDVWDSWCREDPTLESVDSILHSAASLRFTMNAAGDPLRTNVGGAETLRKLVERREMQMHLVSTAYVSGIVGQRVVREVFHPQSDFTNVYEQSKWEAEEIWRGKATILRPSTIVGDSSTGRATLFFGWYFPVKALYMLDGLLRNSSDPDGTGFEIRVPADPGAKVNIVPVDYVAKAAIRIIENPSNHNGVFHLTHTAPPTCAWTHEVFRERFTQVRIKFVGSEKPIEEPRSEFHRMLLNQTERILPYLMNTPEFDRSNTDRAIPEVDVPAITERYLNLLIDYAIGANWGQKP